MRENINLYGQGVVALKDLKKAQELADRLQLPMEALGATKLSLTAGRWLLLENHSGVREYSEDRVCIGCGRGRVNISGVGLEIDSMSERDILLSGRIHTVEWEQS